MQVSPGVSALIARPQRLGLNTWTRIWTSAACPTGSASSVSTVSTLCSSRICHFACSGMSSWATISKDVARADLTACRQMGHLRILNSDESTEISDRNQFKWALVESLYMLARLCYTEASRRLFTWSRRGVSDSGSLTIAVRA